MPKKIEYSFKQFCEDTNRMEILNRWDNELNGISPEQVSFKSNKKMWFKCPEGRHPSEQNCICTISSSETFTAPCRACNSFAQKIIDDYNEEYLDYIWSDKNEKSPWDYTSGSNKEAWFVCPNNPEHIYKQVIYNRSAGCECPYCNNRDTSHGIVKEKSLGYLKPESLDVWSDKNEKTAYDYSPSSGQIVWWKCENGKHDDYQRKICSSNTCDFKCPECASHPEHAPNFDDLTGKVFGQLKVLSYDKDKSDAYEARNKKKQSYWKCLCSCGATVSVGASALKTGAQITCGDRKKHWSGENAPNWKGGKTPDMVAIRNSDEYKEWRDKVLKKDGHRCIVCGTTKKSEAHHIYPFSDYEDKRFDVNNGCTLCYWHHSMYVDGAFHKMYGTYGNTPGQLQDYVNMKRRELGNDEFFNIYKYMLTDDVSVDIYNPDTGLRSLSAPYLK